MYKPFNNFIPYNRQYLDNKDINSVVKVLKGDFITQGKKVIEFEKKFAEYVGAKYAVSCSNGTAALYLSVRSLNLKKNDILLTSTVTFLASANCAHFVQAESLFADIDDSTFCISIDNLKKILRKRQIHTLVTVHMGGHSSDMNEIYKLKKKYNFNIIEDSCHALGGKYKKYKVGSCKFSDISTFSFHPVKPITTGEGGMITTNNKEIYDQLIILRNHGMHKNVKKFINKKLAFEKKQFYNPWYYEMPEYSFNFRLTDFQSALGLSQLKKNDKFIQRRNVNALIYNKKLKNNKFITIPKVQNMIKHAYHLYTIRVDFNALKKTRREVMQELKKYNIGTQVLYIPLHFQPFYKKKYNYKSGDFPVAEKYYDECLSIPIYSSLKKSEVNKIANIINYVIS